MMMMMMMMITTSKTDMGGACSTHGIEYKLVQSFDWQTCKDVYLEDLRINGRVILNCIINEEYKNVHNGLYWLMVQASAGLLRTWKFTFVFYRILFI